MQVPSEPGRSSATDLDPSPARAATRVRAARSPVVVHWGHGDAEHPDHPAGRDPSRPDDPPALGRCDDVPEQPAAVHASRDLDIAVERERPARQSPRIAGPASAKRTPAERHRREVATRADIAGPRTRRDARRLGPRHRRSGGDRRGRRSRMACHSFGGSPLLPRPPYRDPAAPSRRIRSSPRDRGDARGTPRGHRSA